MFKSLLLNSFYTAISTMASLMPIGIFFLNNHSGLNCSNKCVAMVENTVFENFRYFEYFKNFL
jgi:hypothetical protein